MTGTYIDYFDGDTVCEAYVSLPAGPLAAPVPAVLVVHQWAGQGDQERETADRMAALGYVGIAIDVFGKGVRGDPAGDNSALLGPWFGDRAGLLRRLTAAVDFAKGHMATDPQRIGMIGYCFGGLCVLDVARGGVPGVVGVVSLHGVFAKPNLGPQGPISAKLLVGHGYDDPMADPAAMVGLADELTAAGADWQIHAYSGTTHAFTRKSANEPERGMNYSATADRRSWAALTDFFAEVFG
ncbi:dienelactone hydrolase family protein [Sphingomonas sp. SUN039]|uniref:dienelactone hydrolase family protein n=1 Tax=Sphingomonas sp. SUN039 TaxID=2937787 RepID=UPI00216405C8|nr:dienelactone hydrolase family protein [Sphingomonas sp. SUN039]UVO54059.1 dienelactone hydrolase family protein [Sphingomonas sp. SUN039]